MGNALVSVLDGMDLPKTFDYLRPEPIKRMNYLKTFGSGKFRLTTGDHRVVSDVVIEWTATGCASEEYAIRAKYNELTLATYTWTGYFGEDMTVKFTRLDPARVVAKVHYMSGVFQVVTVTDWGNS